MNLVFVLLALTCAVSAYNKGVVPMNYRRAEEPLGVKSAEVKAAVEKEGAVRIPAYTTWKMDLDSALTELKSHLLRPDGPDHNPNDPFIQYVMIVNAINQLIDASLPDGSLYYMVYYNVVSQTILESINSPQESADKVRAQADKTNSKTAAIRDLIVHKQQNACTDPISYSCDLIIDIAVKTSGDSLLKLQAHFLETLSIEFELFLEDYAAEFNEVITDKRAPAYLINGQNRLEPLVMAGVKARNEGKLIPPLLSRRFGGSYKPQNTPWFV